ncbi:MAG TPA: Rpp14/Pop5 family protein [Candidatus Nanoarchaeia archaeon]|nr:Rpp14/Pop5 family protein [Candidatus Nanoarchaeia archaeon]
MKLLPSLKQVKRYILFDLISGKKFEFSEVEAEVNSALLLFLGQLGMAKVSPLLIKERYKNNKFILKVNHKYVDEAIAAMMLIKSIKGVPVIIKSVTTSGTIRKAAEKIKEK